MRKIRDILKSLKRRIVKNKIDSYWIQELRVIRTSDRVKVFEPYINNKTVLHIGCTDYPIFNPKNNLHLKLSKLCYKLDGMDIDKKGIEELKRYFAGTYYNSLENINEEYDTIIVPETIEHVDNIQIFLSQINLIKSKYYIITGPNCFHSFYKNGYKRNHYPLFMEAIHPDHNCWFSPYTLKNCIEKYTTLKVNELHLSNKDLTIVCVCEKK